MLFRNITRATAKAYCSSASSMKTVGHPAKQRLLKLTDTFSSANISEPSTSAKILLGEAIVVKQAIYPVMAVLQIFFLAILLDREIY